jgi:hypothetical protein
VTTLPQDVGSRLLSQHAGRLDRLADDDQTLLIAKGC